jgi:hypothetical protein
MGIFGLKLNHLATLLPDPFQKTLGKNRKRSESFNCNEAVATEFKQTFSERISVQ